MSNLKFLTVQQTTFDVSDVLWIKNYGAGNSIGIQFRHSSYVYFQFDTPQEAQQVYNQLVTVLKRL